MSDPLTADERRCYADNVWRHSCPNALLERLWEAYQAMETQQCKSRARITILQDELGIARIELSRLEQLKINSMSNLPIPDERPYYNLSDGRYLEKVGLSWWICHDSVIRQLYEGDPEPLITESIAREKAEYELLRRSIRQQG